MEYVNEENLRLEILRIQKSNKIKELNLNIQKSDNISLIAERDELLSQGYIEKYPKTSFGEMILQIVKRRATSSKFSGYTYKEEFYSNAIEKIMSYAINNFDENYINPKTGNKSKAFSYITEIASRAFVAIINEYKEEQNEINNLISYESLYQHTNTRSENCSKYNEAKETHELFMKLTYEDGLLFEGTKYDSMFEFLSPFSSKNIKVEYPLEYKINMQEFEQIKSLKFKYLDLVQVKEYKYIPSFPKKTKKTKENLTLEWE